MAKVLISDKLSERAIDIFRERGLEVDFKPGLSVEEQMAIIGDYDGLAIRSATKVTSEMLAAAPLLKVVGRAGIGVDNVDIPAATARGVVVMNTPSPCCSPLPAKFQRRTRLHRPASGKNPASWVLS